MTDDGKVGVTFFGGPYDGRTARLGRQRVQRRHALVMGTTEYQFRRPPGGDDNNLIAWPSDYRMRMLSETARSNAGREASRLAIGDRLTRAGWPRVVAHVELELTTVEHEYAWTRIVWVLLSPGEEDIAEG